MARGFSSIEGANFTPLSFEERTKYLDQYKKYYEDTIEKMALLGDSADSLYDKINQGDNSDSFRRVTAFNDEVKKAANDMAAMGLNSSSITNLLNARRRFATDIKPIYTAIEAWDAKKKAFNEAIAKDADMFYSFNPNEGNLDQWVADNDRQPITYSGTTYRGILRNGFENLKRAIRNNPMGWAKTIPGYYEGKKVLGYTVEEISKMSDSQLANLFANSVSDDNPLNQVILKAMNGIDSRVFDNKDMVKHGVQIGLQEAYNAIGSEDHQMLSDQYGLLMARLKKEREVEEAKNQQVGVQAYSSRTIWSPKTKEEIETALKTRGKLLKSDALKKDPETGMWNVVPGKEDEVRDIIKSGGGFFDLNDEELSKLLDGLNLPTTGKKSEYDLIKERYDKFIERYPHAKPNDGGYHAGKILRFKSELEKASKEKNYTTIDSIDLSDSKALSAIVNALVNTTNGDFTRVNTTNYIPDSETSTAIAQYLNGSNVRRVQKYDPSSNSYADSIEGNKEDNIEPKNGRIDKSDITEVFNGPIGSKDENDLFVTVLSSDGSPKTLRVPMDLNIEVAKDIRKVTEEINKQDRTIDEATFHKGAYENSTLEERRQAIATAKVEKEGLLFQRWRYSTQFFNHLKLKNGESQPHTTRGTSWKEYYDETKQNVTE